MFIQADMKFTKLDKYQLAEVYSLIDLDGSGTITKKELSNYIYLLFKEAIKPEEQMFFEPDEDEEDPSEFVESSSTDDEEAKVTGENDEEKEDDKEY